MPLGYDPQTKVVNLNDTASLHAYLYDSNGNPIDPDRILSVTFTIQKPDQTKLGPYEGDVNDDGSGFYIFADTDQDGEYMAIATFTLINSEVKSTIDNFSVNDPFTPIPPATERQAVQQKVWRKVEDCFDSRDGGPWLREMTMNIFNPDKMDDFIDEAMFEINVYMPATDLSVDYFTTSVDPLNQPNPDMTIIIQATFVAVVRHLMRSYTEQPLLTSGQVTYEDRRDYLMRWGTIYQIEQTQLDHYLKLFKRRFYGFGQTSSLIYSKAGRGQIGYLRARNIGRGFY